MLYQTYFNNSNYIFRLSFHDWLRIFSRFRNEHYSSRNPLKKLRYQTSFNVIFSQSSFYYIHYWMKINNNDYVLEFNHVALVK